MVRIISDSSTMLNVKEGKEHGITISPLSVTINGKSYRELEEITAEEFIKLINEGFMPTTSQPSIGEKMHLYETLAKNDEIIDITIADGLSGTYHSACTAKDDCPHNDNIHVFNSKTLCGPHRYLVLKAVDLASKGFTAKQIIQELKTLQQHEKSFLIPSDFAFLKRGGRLTPIAATIGGLLKIVPVMTLTDDKSKLEKYTVKRTLSKAIIEIDKCFQDMQVDESFYITITHAENEELAKKVASHMKEEFPNTEIEIYPLTPAFIAQGGPGCIAIQVIKKSAA